jgi:hypothetical protein
VYENRVVRGIFGPKREKVTEGWTKLHNALFIKYFYSNEIKKDEMGRTHQ